MPLNSNGFLRSHAKSTMTFPIRFLLFLLLMPLPLWADQSVEQVYHRQCATCHGNNGDGQGRAGASLSPAPSNFRSPAMRARSDAQLAAAIRNGKPGSAMSAYGSRLSEAQITALVKYIRTSFMRGSGQAHAAAPAPVKPQVPVKNVDRKTLGRQLYETNCSACHGDDGNTAVWARNSLVPPPRDFTTELSRKLLGRERMIQSVTNGRPGTGMMSFADRLQPHEIETVVDFIRAEFMHVGELSLHEENKLSRQMDQPFSQGLKGDAKQGRAFFMANCADCHGRLGDGNGPRASFNQPRPRNFMTAESRAMFDRPKLFNAIKNGKRGTVMPAWGKVLSDQEIANVAEFVYLQFIQQSPAAVEKKN